MDCGQIEKWEIAEKYVTNQLSEGEQADFETHFLGCRRCFEQVQLWQDMRAALKLHPRRGVRWRAIVAVAAGLLLAAGVAWRRERLVPQGQTARVSAPGAVRASASPALELAALATISPPHYTPPQWRGVGQTGFDEAMRSYTRGDYAAAMPKLLTVLNGDAGNSAARFFLGICYLMQGQDDEGIVQLKATIALQDSPELEEAHLYLAKALLRKQDVSGAIAELRKAIALHGPRQLEERSLLDRIGEVRPKQ